MEAKLPSTRFPYSVRARGAISNVSIKITLCASPGSFTLRLRRFGRMRSSRRSDAELFLESICQPGHPSLFLFVCWRCITAAIWLSWHFISDLCIASTPRYVPRGEHIWEDSGQISATCVCVRELAGLRHWLHHPHPAAVPGHSGHCCPVAVPGHLNSEAVGQDG